MSWLVSALSGCDTTKERTFQESGKAGAREGSNASEAKALSEGRLVKLEEGGSKFYPPVQVEMIPMGAWMCDMGGSVHFASHEKGDGKCPDCEMDLVRRRAGGSSERQDEEDHHHGDHGNHD